MNNFKKSIVLAFLALSLGTMFLKGDLPAAPINAWVDGPALSVARTGACVASIPGGGLLVTGGVDPGGTVLGTAEILGPGAASFSPVAPMSIPRSRHACAALPDGKVLVVGGRTSGAGFTNATETYDPALSAWVSGPPIPGPARAGHAATVLSEAAC